MATQFKTMILTQLDLLKTRFCSDKDTEGYQKDGPRKAALFELPMETVSPFSSSASLMLIAASRLSSTTRIRKERKRLGASDSGIDDSELDILEAINGHRGQNWVTPQRMMTLITSTGVLTYRSRSGPGRSTLGGASPFPVCPSTLLFKSSASFRSFESSDIERVSTASA